MSLVQSCKKDFEITENEKEDLFKKIYELTENLNQFEGNAFLGNVNGTCYMVLDKNTQGQDIALFRYQILGDRVDETYTIHDLKRVSIAEEPPFKEDYDEYESIYLKGIANGLKVSMNNGKIEDNSTQKNRNFIILLNRSEKELLVILSTSQFSYQVSLSLSSENYDKFKTIFFKDPIIERFESENIDENFELFLEKFSQNYPFQISRVGFPLSIVEFDENLDPYNDDPIHKKINENEYKSKFDFRYEDYHSSLKHSAFTQEIKLNKDKAKIEIRGVNNGIFSDAYFEKQNGKWMFVRFEDFSN